MAIRKTKMQTQRTDARLLLESDEPVELPPAEVEESSVVLQFESLRQYVPELLDTLRAGTTAELVPVMRDGSTFAVHTRTRTFWVKLWHAGTSDMTRVERVQVLSCLPSTRGVQVIVGDEEDYGDDEPDGFDEDDLDDADADGDPEEEGDEEPNVNFESR
ncbi:MAG: hypothetical protein LC785_16785 [Acidobacteria bacterium]|nr:hypothetical protein [Acidobacteriota bacterium]MCA1643557.1 hypothetical protein [Acidobacteriota bacterium]